MLLTTGKPGIFAAAECTSAAARTCFTRVAVIVCL